MEKICKNHPNVKAFSFCHSCNEYFCEDCLEEGEEYYYCLNSKCQVFLKHEIQKYQTKKINKVVVKMERWYSFMFGHKKSIEKMLLFGFLVFFVASFVTINSKEQMPNYTIISFYSTIFAVFGLLGPLFYAILFGSITRIFSKKKASFVFIWTYRIFYWGLFTAVLIKTLFLN